MLMPETRADARLLLLCLEIGYLPTYEEAVEEEVGLGLKETELKARGA